MTIGNKIFAGYALSIACMLLVAIAGLYGLKTARSAYRQFIEVDQELVLDAHKLKIAVLKQVEGYRGFLLLGKESQLKPFEEGIEEFHAVMAVMQAVASDPQDRNDLAGIAEIENRWVAMQRQIIDLRRKGMLEEALKRTRGEVTPLRNEMLGRLTPLVERHMMINKKQNSIPRSTELMNSIRRVSLFMAVASALSLLGGLISAFLFTRLIRRQLKENIARICSFSAEISVLTDRAVLSASEERTAMSEVTSRVGEMKEKTQEAFRKARQVSESVQMSVQALQLEKGSVGKTLDEMNRIREQMELVAGSVARLREQSCSVRKMIAALDKLAGESELLASDASMEAVNASMAMETEEAGGPGGGFTVMAQEVEILAEGSRQVTDRARSMLEEIQKATGEAVAATERESRIVEAGVRQAMNAGESARRLAESMLETTKTLELFVLDCEQQLAEMNNIASVIDGLKRVSAQSAANTKETERAAHNLHEQEQKLKHLVEG